MNISPSSLKKNDTKTFLGFLDQPVVSKNTNNNDCCRGDHTDDDDEEDQDTYPYLTKIGGLPIWCAQPPSQFKDLKCTLCGNYLAFLLQAYCPLNSLPTYERNFYIFACTQSQCSSQSQGWKVIKCLDPLKEEEEEQQQQEEDNIDTTPTTTVNNKNEDDWGLDGEDEWGVSNSVTTTKEEKSIDELLKLRDIKLKEEKLQQQQSKDKLNNIRISEAESEEIISGIIIQEDKSNFFQAYHLFIEEESNYIKTSSKEKESLNNSLLKKYENYEAEFNDDSSEWSSETYEYVKDRVFNKFLKN
ncbi:hypothetical protein CYY_004718 [Polysphondylium violaceum]|uniref:Programmed cell death protein 2 C-terminal domain-containing protein n=1 Tax=Polysphondylium violaceum TaxID=133409 RepID=A0A8J4PU67_9MYCE|nr:hypothetical protein CYY_004718 [Polysphondylium violaceum]